MLLTLAATELVTEIGANNETSSVLLTVSANRHDTVEAIGISFPAVALTAHDGVIAQDSPACLLVTAVTTSAEVIAVEIAPLVVLAGVRLKAAVIVEAIGTT